MAEIKNRQAVKAVAALLILFFHLWVSPFQGNTQLSIALTIEDFIRQTAYIGVDMFFLISAYSIAKYSIDDYKAFVLKRSGTVYIKFVLFAITAFIYKKWKLNKLLLTICGADLFIKGGGSFLWFLPVIILVYIFLPLYKRADEKNRPLALGLVLACWLIIGILVGQITDYNAFYIAWNRIPVILAGFYWGLLTLSKKPFVDDEMWKQRQNRRASVACFTILLLTGILLLYGYGYKPRLQYPMPDMFYVLAVPAAMGLTYLSSLIKSGKIIKYISRATLEMYGVQMVFGYNICNRLVNIISGKSRPTLIQAVIINLLSALAVTVISVIISQIYSLIERK